MSVITETTKRKYEIHDFRKLARQKNVLELARKWAKDRKRHEESDVTYHTSKSDCIDALYLFVGADLSPYEIVKGLRRVRRSRGNG